MGLKKWARFLGFFCSHLGLALDHPWVILAASWHSIRTGDSNCSCVPVLRLGFGCLRPSFGEPFLEAHEGIILEALDQVQAIK